MRENKIDLPSVKAAAFDSHVDELNAQCHPGTREDLLHRIRGWAQDPQGKCIFWLNGKAGTGKSTISRTVAQSFAENGQLGASFFFKRGESGRDNASRFFTTIALHLVRRMPALVPYVRSAIDAEPEISEKRLKEQFEKLIFQPLSQATQISKQISTLVIVIDALDECKQEHVETILRLLPQAGNLQSVRMRVFLTSRPELPIRLGFKEMSAGAHQDVVLEDMPQVTIEHDISVYLTVELARIKKEYNMRFPDSQLPSDWPGQKNIQALAIMAVPLFIFAATVCRFVGDRMRNPKKQLAIILEQTANQASGLDQTYLPILRQLVDGCTDPESLAREFREIIGSIIILADPLSTSSLANLLDISKEYVDNILDGLHSVLSIPSYRDSPVRLLHLSFRDFLLDPKKKEKSEFWFWVDETKTHEMIATRCLELMSRRNCLRENICDLEFPGKLRNEIDRKTLHDCLPRDVRYACQYWVHHLKESERRIRDQDAVHLFLQQHFLHWLEALSLMGDLSKSIALINTLQSLVAVSSY
jgi:NACHT domain